MVNWRELGEVPDSEDDDAFDSQNIDSQPREDPTSESNTRGDDQSEAKDIWDIPSSQEEHLHAEPIPTRRPSRSTPSSAPPTHSPASSPLSSVCSSPELPPIRGFSVEETREPAQKSSAQQPTIPNDELSAPIVQLSSSLPDFLGQDGPPESIPRPSPGMDQTPVQSQILGHDAEELEEARRAAFRYERSLRARRPEQVRPYFTEMARFTNAWRNHGLRPVRFANEQHEERMNQRGESSEPDFIPPSQESNPPNPGDDSYPQDPNDLEGLLVPGLSSSPMRTSPLENYARPSSQSGSRVDTDNTSLDGDDLPTLQDLARKRHQRSTAHSAAKRRLSPIKTATARKRARRLNILDSDDSPKPRRTFLRPPGSSDPGQLPTEPNDQIFPDFAGSPIRDSNTPAAMIIHDDSDDNIMGPAPEAEEGEASQSDSGPDEEAVNQTGLRIRGVLPASWLRLDQVSGRNKAQNNLNRRQIDRSPERENRRGVAKRRQAHVSSTQAMFPFEDSEDEAPAHIQATTDEIFHNQTRLTLELTAATQHAETLSSNDNASVMEEDHIDRMMPGRKRQVKLSDSFKAVQKRPKSMSRSKSMPMNTFKSIKQPKLPGASKPPTQSGATGRGGRQKRSQQPKPRSRGNERQATASTSQSRRRPPQLSVLDVIEPCAPQFLKIAARTARGRSDQGRSRPERKHIQLATRTDHIDAYAVLQDWTSGSIKQRPTVTAARKARRPQVQARPLSERSANALDSNITRPTAARAAPRKFTKQTSHGGHISYKPQEAREGKHPLQRSPSLVFDKPSSRPCRPAQLEIDDASGPSVVNFHTGKKLLDRLYRARHGDSTIAESVISGPGVNHVASIAPNIQEHPTPARDENINEPKRQRPTARSRKKTRPTRIDVEEAQYSHAHDPLPAESPSTIGPVPVVPEAAGSKLQGLGPYGTQYSHHFEIFPLTPGVYFHQSTLLGSGLLETAVNFSLSQKLGDPQPRTSLTLGEQTMRWGTWNAQVSSELGIVLDYVADQLDKAVVDLEDTASPTAVSAMHHVVLYIKESMTFDAESDAKSFVSRTTEVMQSFNSRVSAASEKGDLDCRVRDFLGVYDRLIMTSLLSLRICRCDSTLMSEQFQAEDLLKSVAKTLIQFLSRLGVSHVKAVYDSLNRTHFREQGLRDHTPEIHSWALIMRILEYVKIPRSSFWDIAQTALVPSNFFLSVDSTEHEKLWKAMFTLLPLVEFNDVGVVVATRRYQSLTDGWGLPQKLLKRVFQLYQENTRQAPSFNSYCRALVARCHYLVQQWGWYRCSNIVGVIFDFFGSQNLAHLRNEEIYTSPRFLEELAKEPSLEIEREDKCFHIFLKLVALSIRKLREHDLSKDIRNLVARTVPNHSRQFLKEQNIHERDLSALRNHHDLLCTLYWAAPPEMRPNVGFIERLVAPASSHKEACKINLRAWNQLARFVVATGEATVSFKPFNAWRTNFFQQIMQQYDSIASDIEQQFSGLSKDISDSISTEMIGAMVSANKAAVMDVLHLSSTVSLDVMKRAPDLESATFAMSTLQLQKIFKHFSAAPPELDWSILRVSLLTLGSFLAQVDRFKDDEESQQSESQILNSAQADDALLVLNHDLASSFFQMARCVLSPRSRREIAATAALDKAACTEQVVILSARLGMRFINAGVMRLSAMFKAGKHGLFGDTPNKLSLDERRSVVLFVTTLLEYGFDDFNGEDFSLRELWMLSIVKPQHYLAYENKLAQQLIRHGKDFVPEAVVGLAVSPDYYTNRDMFEFAISSMRRSFRDAGPNMKKILLSEYKRTLQMVMDQIKVDLATVASNRFEHPSYLIFIRNIISLIRAHGPDICAVDDYFYQISKEYSPSVQDPQLQVAGMVSYGLRLSEGDTRVIHQLFYFLINSFKMSLMNDKLPDEVRMLARGLGNPGIVHFSLGKMLPAIVQASVVERTASPLFDVYVEAFYLLLGDDDVPPQLSVDNLPCLRVTLDAISNGIYQLHQQGISSNDDIHLLRQLLSFVNLIWPSLYLLVLSKAISDDLDSIKASLGHCRPFMKWLVTSPETLWEGPSLDLAQETPGPIEPNKTNTQRPDPHVISFKDNIVNDVRMNWIMSNNRLSIQAPGKARNTQSTQSEQGIKRPTFARSHLVKYTCEAAREWNGWWDKVFGRPKSNKAAALLELPVF